MPIQITGRIQGLDQSQNQEIANYAQSLVLAVQQHMRRTNMSPNAAIAALGMAAKILVTFAYHHESQKQPAEANPTNFTDMARAALQAGFEPSMTLTSMPDDKTPKT